MSHGVYDATQDILIKTAGMNVWADLPVGAIIPYGGATAPSGWFICDGTELVRTTYPELFAVIGTAFGSADSTHFNIPDMRESVPKGAGITGKTVGAHLDADGLVVGEFLDDQLQAHTHSNKTGTSIAGQDAWTMFATNQVETAVEQTNNGVVGRFGATTEVKAVGVNYIIKAKMVAVPADFMSKVGEAVEDVFEITSGNLTPNSNVVSFDTGGWAKWTKYGRIVYIDVQLLRVASEYTPDVTLLTGAPLPLVGAHGGQLPYLDGDKILPVVVNSNGSIHTQGGTLWQGIIHGAFSYISAT